MYSFPCVLWILRQIARYLPHHTNGNASKTHSKSAHDKFKTVSRLSALPNKYSCILDAGIYLCILMAHRMTQTDMDEHRFYFNVPIYSHISTLFIY